MFTKSVLTALVAVAAAAPVLEPRQDDTNPRDLEDFISRQFDISLEGALLNIGGVNGNVVQAAGTGFVVASPSTVNPDYFYTWTRDSALTEIMLIDELIFGTETVGNNSLQVVAEQYVRAQAELQTVTNPSGALWPAGQGLGEPKFYSNGKLYRFNGAWGRPQNDGPALRASALMEIAEAIYLRNNATTAAAIVGNVYWPLIQNDLLYVAQYWNTSSYDLWEEVNGNSFFTLTAQHRALVQGTIWAERLDKECEACEQAPLIAYHLANDFWNSTGGYLLANVNANQVNRSQINCDPILGAMHAFDINAACDAVALQPCNSKTLSTHRVWVDSFRDLYAVNENATAPAAVLTGRYPEDTYYGGNPGEVTIDNISLAFWQDLVPDAQEGVFTDYANVSVLLDAVHTYADGFVALVEQYAPANGTLNEQINRTTGESTSAIALTWSFAAFVTAIDRRDGNFPPSWGANSSTANELPATGSWGSYNATTQYTPALAAGAPNVTQACETQVILNLLYATGPGENTYIVGNTSVFGNTLSDTSRVIQTLRTNNVTAGNPQWFVPAYLPAGVPVEYKYVVLNSTDNTYKFENVSHLAYPPACGNNTVVSYLINGTSLYSS